MNIEENAVGADAAKPTRGRSGRKIKHIRRLRKPLFKTEADDAAPADQEQKVLASDYETNHHQSNQSINTVGAGLDSIQQNNQQEQ